ncbi:MAG: class I SAM-dependent methyltransferase [Patescibacteria group bacterium]|mgnify:CR=1 FL=1
MRDKKQAQHFKAQGNRYGENLLLNPPLHVVYETQNIITELRRKGVRTVVDFGSGNGRLSIPLLQAGFTVHCVDISLPSLKRLLKIAKQMGCDKKLSIATRLPQHTVDAVVGTDILHHVHIGEELKDIRTVLRKKGYVLFSEPNILNPAWLFFISFFLDWKVEWRIIFCNYFTLRKMFRENCFPRINIDGHGLLPPPFFNKLPLLQKINYYFGNFPLLKLFSYRYLISAFK